MNPPLPPLPPAPLGFLPLYPLPMDREWVSMRACRSEGGETRVGEKNTDCCFRLVKTLDWLVE